MYIYICVHVCIFLNAILDLFVDHFCFINIISCAFLWQTNQTNSQIKPSKPITKWLHFKQGDETRLAQKHQYEEEGVRCHFHTLLSHMLTFSILSKTVSSSFVNPYTAESGAMTQKLRARMSSVPRTSQLPTTPAPGRSKASGLFGTCTHIPRAPTGTST